MFLIVGANGYLGRYIIKNLEVSTDEPIIATTRNTIPPKSSSRTKWVLCDVTREDQVVALRNLTEKAKELKVIYLATYFNVNDDTNRALAWDVNIVSYARFLSIMNNMTSFYSFSTDMLFSESREEPYTEVAEILPLNCYAVHKSIEERMAIACGWNVIRLPVLVGPSLVESKKHFFDEIISNFKKGKPMKFFVDSWRSMLDFDTASKLIINLINNKIARRHPIINVSGDMAISKYTFAVNLATAYNFPLDLVEPISMDEDCQIWKKKRPKKILLDNSLVKKILNIRSVNMDLHHEN